MSSLLSQIARLKELEEQATFGPWKKGLREHDCVAGEDGSGMVVLRKTNGGSMPSDANLNLICGLRNAAPALLTALGMIQPGDSSLLWRIAARTHCPNEDDSEAGNVACQSCQEEKDILRRLAEMCKLMEEA
jgi:hypothetical protein